MIFFTSFMLYNLMPQLDFFLYQHVVFWTILIFLALNVFLWNTAIMAIFKSIKTRHLLIKKLDTEAVQQETLKEPSVNEIFKEIEDYKSQVKINN